MIDYKYNKIIKNMNSEELRVLRELIDTKEKEMLSKDNGYLGKARNALDEFFYDDKSSERPGFRITDSGLVLFNGNSMYLLNSDEVLTEEYKNNSDFYISSKVRDEDLLRTFNKFLNREYARMIGIEDNYDGLYRVYSDYFDFFWFRSLTHTVNKKYYDQMGMFLGEDAKYQLCTDRSAVLASSDKGRALLLGLKE